jgi:glycine/D-amino acid oxidase-like deaminating enzyme
MARKLGARIHPGSPVLEITTRGGVHHLRTPGGTVRARAVGIATGAYTSLGLTPFLRGRCMPIMSNSIVTRPPAFLHASFSLCTIERVQGHYAEAGFTSAKTLRCSQRTQNQCQLGRRVLG